MNQIRITKEFRFEAAHALKGYDGPCRNIHGHSYELSVTIIGTPNPDPLSPKSGMVVDFGDLKRLIRKEIIDPLDHSLMLHADSEKDFGLNSVDPFCNILFLPFQPTSENLLIDFARRIKALLPPGSRLFSLRLRETATSFAEWFDSDNCSSGQI